MASQSKDRGNRCRAGSILRAHRSGGANAVCRSRRDPAAGESSRSSPGHSGLQSLHRRTDILAGTSGGLSHPWSCRPWSVGNRISGRCRNNRSAGYFRGLDRTHCGCRSTANGRPRPVRCKRRPVRLRRGKSGLAITCCVAKTTPTCGRCVARKTPIDMRIISSLREFIARESAGGILLALAAAAALALANSPLDFLYAALLGYALLRASLPQVLPPR